MTDLNVDLVAGAYELSTCSHIANKFVPDWQNESLLNWFLPSARAVCIRKNLWDTAGKFPEHLTLTGEDTLFDIQYRRHSNKWLLSLQSVVDWHGPTCEISAAKLAYSYGKGDGESGFGDFAFYENLVRVQRGWKEYHVDAAFCGYLDGRKNRSIIEVQKRGIKGLFIILSGVPFTDSGGGQRCSQLAMALVAKGYKVIFVNIYPSYEEPQKLYFDTDFSLLEFYSLDDFSLPDFHDRYGIHEDLSIYCISEFPHPRLATLNNDLKLLYRDRIKIIYDYIDNWQSTLGWDWYSPDVEQSFIDTSDMVIASAKTLIDNLKTKTTKDVYLIANAYNERVFNVRTKHLIQPDLPKDQPVILYVGALWGDWFDWDLLKYCATSLNECLFAMIGGAAEELKQSISNEYKNIKFLGLKPHIELPAYLQYSNVCHIPFKLDHVTHFVNPLKVYEYLAMNKPVVASDMSELRTLPGTLLASNYQEYASMLRSCIQANYNFPTLEVQTQLKTHSWTSRVESLENLLKN
jgi:glycosyltransferase involved in cell wall biosynthesis